ncbi:FAD-binding protein [Helcobacillus massiliensis]|uniref:D-arabinono-1,4-lactone oxidase n=1 Tax=Helcobacillus massiliensis TaxID=521392 RepID=UPI0021A2CA92|nr:D-arabinono-1,4-lactone oxidase [Helcobacillus massiliensis]MCT1558756.1 FAD-binding protein [Helcobacillus massiliensis]MCT2037520.1 FAD-binding protein [Helcobacillus massiliensis]
MTPLPLADKRTLTSNWSGSVDFSAADVEHPGTESAVIHHIARATAHGHSLRPIGAGHSFSPLCETDGTLLTLDNHRGLVKVDRATGDATFRAGTRLMEIGPALARHGRAMINMGDVDAQSIAGAISTGTHGMGHQMQGLAATVTGLRIALASGDVVWADKDTNPRLFEAARLSLGVIGIILEVRMATAPAFRLESRDENLPVDDAVAGFLQSSTEADHQEIFWFPGSTRATLHTMHRREAGARRSRPNRVSSFVSRELLANGVWEIMCRAGTRSPRVAPALADVASRFFPGAAVTDDSHTVFTAPRRVRFHEAEYAIAAEAFPEAFGKVRARIHREFRDVLFPLEIRRAAADDVWMSTCYDRDTIYIAAHTYHRRDGYAFQQAVQEELMEFDPRPHWGKMHWLDADYFARVYPRFDDFRTVRAEVDPKGIFLNDHTRTVLDV